MMMMTSRRARGDGAAAVAVVAVAVAVAVVVVAAVVAAAVLVAACFAKAAAQPNPTLPADFARHAASVSEFSESLTYQALRTYTHVRGALFSSTILTRGLHSSSLATAPTERAER
jgi:hypothetical protein